MSALALTHATTDSAKLERLAYWQIRGDAPATLCALLAADRSPLPNDQAETWFAELVEWVGNRDGVEAGEIHADEIDPELRGDDIAALAVARRRVEEALDALVGAAVELEQRTDLDYRTARELIRRPVRHP